MSYITVGDLIDLPGEPRGPFTVMECPECHACVLWTATDAHSEWHERQIATFHQAPVSPDDAAPDPAVLPIAPKDDNSLPWIEDDQEMHAGVNVRVKRLEHNGTLGMFIHPRYLAPRRAGVTGLILSYVPGHGGDVWWVRHDDGTIAAYASNELERQ